MSWYSNLVDPVLNKPQPNVQAPGALAEPKLKTKHSVKPSPSQLESLKTRKAWDIAMGPAKQIPMNLIMSYMSGSSLQMIPITMTLMLFSNALSAILGINDAFRGLSSANNKHDILLAKMAFVALQLVIIGIGVYKLNSMGLIPNKAGDWLSWEEPTLWS